MAPFETRNGKFGIRIGIGGAWTAMVVADGEARGQKFRTATGFWTRSGGARLAQRICVNSLIDVLRR